MAVTFHARYVGDLRCEIVHDPSKAVIVTDPPVDNNGRGESFSPTDMCASSLAVCMMTMVAITARKLGIEPTLAGATGTAEKHMHTGATRRIARIVVDLRYPAGVPVEHRASLEHAGRTCPVALSLHPDILQEASFTWG